MAHFFGGPAEQEFIRKEALLDELNNMMANTMSKYQKDVLSLLIQKVERL